jgi:DNA-binding response OmpR family regulator
MIRILVIDDEDEVRQVLRQMLVREGFEVVDAPDGKAGLKLFREHPAEVVITDIIMPEKDGLETMEEIRKNCPETKIIAISGGGRLEPSFYLDLARRLGACRTLYKPFALEEIVAAVQEVMGVGIGSTEKSAEQVCC